MAGNAKPGEEDRPQEEAIESTVAMESPGVTPGVPLPISNPPPAMAAPSAPEKEKARSPVAPGVTPSPLGARPPLGRPAGPPGIPSSTRNPQVGVGRVPLPSAGAGAPGAKPPGAPLGPPGVSAKRTVMGLAPPANISSSKPGGAAPLQPAPAKSPGIPLRSPASAGGPMSPAAPAPKASPIGAHAVPKLDSPDDEPPDDGPTVASDLGGVAQMQAAAAANYPLSDAPPKPVASPTATAKHAPAQNPPASMQGNAASQRSPFSSTGYAQSSSPQERDEEENEAATVTVPKDVLDRVRADPKAVLAESKPRAPVPAAGRPYSDMDDSAEPTKAVPRDELLGRAGAQRGGQDHVVIGADAGGEDATLAVAPGANEASSMNLGAAIGSALGQGNMPSPLGDGAFPPPHGHGPPQGHPYQSYQDMGPPQQPQHPQHTQHTQQDWNMQGPPSNQHWSSGHMPAANPRTPGGVQSYPGGPMMQHPQAQGPMGGIPRAQAPTNWNPVQAPQPKSKVSGQMILLFVVGFVCLAIFVTGIVLFATTKF